MILTAGLLANIYPSFLVLPKESVKGPILNRSIILFLTTYFIYLLTMINDWQSTLILWDGNLKLNSLILISESYIILLLIILLLGVKYIKGEIYLLILSATIGILYLISSNDWLVTVISWESINLSLYFILGMKGINSNINKYSRLISFSNTNTNIDTNINRDRELFKNSNKFFVDKESSISATIKYFLLSSLTTGFLLLGVALIYGLTGTTNYDHSKILLNYIANEKNIKLMNMNTLSSKNVDSISSIDSSIESSNISGYDFSSFTNYYELASQFSQFSQFSEFSEFSEFKIIFIGLLILVPVLFKLAIAPFHFWGPDLYDKLPITITIWLATIPKIGTLVFLLQIFDQFIFPNYTLNDIITNTNTNDLAGLGLGLGLGLELGHLESNKVFLSILNIAGVISLLIGSIALSSQFKILRFLAYSTISHFALII